MCSLAPVGGAERQNRQGERQGGEGQGQQGAVTPGHFLQHGCSGTDDGCEPALVQSGDKAAAGAC